MGDRTLRYGVMDAALLGMGHKYMLCNIYAVFLTQIIGNVKKNK